MLPFILYRELTTCKKLSASSYFSNLPAYTTWKVVPPTAFSPKRVKIPALSNSPISLFALSNL